MRRLTCSALLATAVCIAAAAPAASAPARATSKSISFVAAGPQQHVIAETVGDTPADPVGDSCVAPRCYAFPFSPAAPTKGAKSVTASAQITWTSPTARFWLSIMDVTKATPVEVAQCFTFYTSAGPSATVEGRLPVGRKYAVWVSVQQVVGLSEPVKGVVNSPAKDKPRVSPLSGADRTGLFLNPCQG